MATNTEFSKALQLHRSGRLAEAEAIYRGILEPHPDHPGALHLLGLIEISKGNYDNAARLIGRSIASGGPNATSLNDLGSAYRAAGQLKEAADAYGSALDLKKDLMPAWIGLSGTLREQGRMAGALDVLEEGARLLPNESRLRLNLASLHAESGNFVRAAAAYRTILDREPGRVDASLGLGSVLRRMEKEEEAEAAYRQALELLPGNPDLLNALAEIRIDAGELVGAERLLRQALENRPGHIHAWFNLGKTLLSAGRMDADFLARWLSIDGPVPGIVRQAGIEYVKKLAEFPTLADRVPVDPVEAGEFLKSGPAASLMTNPVLGLLLRKGRVDDADLERVLTALRRACLLSFVNDPAGTGSVSGLTEFLLGLAQQCFHNEYVYAVAPDEEEALSALSRCIEHGSASSKETALLAAYFPLSHINGNSVALDGNTSGTSHEFRRLLELQISEPLAERKLATSIRSLTAIDDPVSRAVRGQYEDHPYPRWREISRLETQPMGIVMSGLFPSLTGKDIEWPSAPDILIAGCGTGHQSVSSAQRFAHCQVTAIDLSLASLAYAKRKTKQAGIRNIDYLQGDILELTDLEQRFDIIECTGVLHHMSDPAEGWRVLRRLLRPGGLMKIGLYSEMGRESIVAARELIAGAELQPDAEGMREARQLIMSLPDDHAAKQVLKRPDFYTMSTCRDLLFHVQEHRLALPVIATMLKALDLEFLGFELPSSQIAQAFRERFPDDPDMRSLENWDRFERDNAGTFSRMYLFWVCDARSVTVE
ncbi:MAG: tetratricopeptide repeat protein [Gammaproteobacteria bacterium]